MDDGYIDCLLLDDMDTGEDGTDGMGQVAPALRSALLVPLFLVSSGSKK